MTFLYLKAVHIIFVVTWFAGLFYMPRLFVNIADVQAKEEPSRSILTKQLVGMASRLWYGITWPSAIITLAMGAAMLINQPEWLSLGFMQVKLILVALLYLYHFSLQYLFKCFKSGDMRFSGAQMRIWNEVATLFLIAIVFLIVLKNSLSMVWGLLGLLVITVLIMTGIKLYKKFRNDNEND